MDDDSTRTMTGGPVAAAGDHQLRPGDVLADRFTIIQFIARGGMGEVYEAADRYFHNRHFALKTLRDGGATEPSIQQRFEREVLLAREVRHDNVCPTFDLFRVEGPRGPTMFLTMKLLHGESLAARLARGGPLDLDAALPIVRQMADALDAAHRAGVIHRDFKPGNVMLELTGKAVHVSITDFGLSRQSESHGLLVEHGQVSGTMGYIAPELLQGRVASPASDVYAFGVVLYELLTGHLPRHKPGKPEFLPPSAVVSGIPRAWDRMVLGCLEPDPARRFQTAGEAVTALTNTSGSARAAPARRSLPRWSKMTAAAMAVIVLAVAGWLTWPMIDAARHPLPRQRFVALMAWPADPTPENGPLLKSALDAIALHLGRAEASSKDLLIIAAGDVTGQAAPKRPSDTVNALGANLVLAASLRSSGSTITLSLNVLEAATGRTLRTRTVSLASQALGRLPEQATSAAAVLLGVTLPASEMTDTDELAHVGPSAFQAFSAAEELVVRANDSGLDQAIEKYQEALTIDPKFALAYARIAMAYTRRFNKTHDAAVLVLAARNSDQAVHFNPDSAKAVLSSAMVQLYSGHATEALDAIAHALRLDPGNPQVLLFKAVAFRFLARPADEEGVYREIIRARPNYWPAYNELGGSLHRHGHDTDAAEAFAEASAIAPQAVLPLTNLGTMYMLLGRKTEAAEAFQKSLARTPSWLVYIQLGNMEYGDGQYQKALDDYMHARDLRPNDDLAWRSIGDCQTMLGDRAKALESYTRAVDLLSGSLRTNPLRPQAWMALALYQAKIGRTAESAQSLKEAETRGATDVPSLFNKVQLLAVLGRKDEALRLLLELIDRGLSKVEVDLALDLADLRQDPRYLNHKVAAVSKL